MKERTKNWHQKFLSEGGKEVLLKSVALAMPTYAKSCFKLHISTCHEIDSMLSQFWWGSNDSKRRMAWVSWKKMSLPKKEGGLGFMRNLNVYWLIFKKQIFSRLYIARGHSSA